MEKKRPKVFESTDADIYDHKIRMRVPCYEELPDIAIASLSTELNQNARVLVVGAGTGYELTQMALKQPAWDFEAVEPSDDMRNIAISLVAQKMLQKRVCFHGNRLEEIEPILLCDGATSILVSHFIPDNGAKEHFFRQLGKHIKPGGILFIVDLMEPSAQNLKKAWSCWMYEKGVAPEVIEESCNTLSRSFFPITEVRLNDLLKQSGFIQTTQVYQGLGFCGYIAQKKK